jgi:carbonic anhydrase/acetyltransferase-like protein (isoleucine patch superfamily)
MALIRGFSGKLPRIAPDAFIAENATIIGDVEIGPGVSIWYGAVLRGDVGAIRVGARSNIQDLACVHMTTDLSNALIGEDVVVGHGAIIHGAVVGNGVLVGMGSILLDNAEIGDQSIVGAGAMVTARFKAPSRSLILGSPAKVVRELKPGEADAGLHGATDYMELSHKYRE